MVYDKDFLILLLCLVSCPVSCASRSVGVQHVVDQYNFVGGAVLGQVPIVLKLHLPWGAQEWTPKTLLQKINKEKIRNVKVSRSMFFQYCHDAPLDVYPHIVSDYRKKCFRSQNMSSSLLLELLEREMSCSSFDSSSHLSSDTSSTTASSFDLSSSFVSYSSVLDQFGPSVQEDLEFLDLLSLKNTPCQTTIWLSSKHTITPLHFDISHNFFVQVFGSKHFLLLPPNETTTLSLYPSLHPGRQSVRFPQQASLSAYAYEVVLEEGDILYIPPHWLHQVTSLDVSISVAVWSHDAATTLYEDMMDNYFIPIPVSWDSELRISGLRYVLQALAHHLHVNLSNFVKLFLLSRYFDIFIGDEQEESFASISLSSDQMESLTSALRVIVHQFERILVAGGTDRRNIFLADFFEVATLSVLGAHHLRPFFRGLIAKR